MVLSLPVWGNKIASTFKDQEEDIVPLQYAVVQLTMKTINTKAATTGHMLEIKTMRSLPGLSLSAFRLLPFDTFAHSLQGAAAMYERFTAEKASGAADDEANESPNENQGLIKSNISSSVHFISTRIDNTAGIFAVGPDGKIVLHVSEPIADLSHSQVVVHFDPTTLGFASVSGNEEYIAKTLNVMTIAKAVQLFVIVDTYRPKEAAQGDTSAHGFVRVDVSSIINSVTHNATLKDPETSYVAKTVSAANLKHFLLYEGLNSQLDLTIDTRCVSKKPNTDPRFVEPTSTLVSQDARWQRGYFLNFFFAQSAVLSIVLPSIASVGDAVERARRALQPIEMLQTMEGVVFDEVEMPQTTEGVVFDEV